MQERFAKLTQIEINEFVKICKEFALKFEAEGPGSVKDLQIGFELMDEYRDGFK